MVAYSFRPRFVEAIERGSKRQTIRADRKRHARPGEEVQLYTGMRTRSCRLIRTAICERVGPIRLDFARATMDAGFHEVRGSGIFLDTFAQDDGFADWEEMREFWRREHGAIDAFTGVIICWR